MNVFCEADLSIRSMKQGDIDVILNRFSEQSWPKPREVLERYFTRQNAGELSVFIADYAGDVAGYAILYPTAEHGPFTQQGIPEISDFIVFIKYQRNGIGNKILDAAERKAAELCERVSLGVGLHSGYGTAQRIYIKRGYIPDGSGIWFRNAQLKPYMDCTNDDELVLYLSKDIK